MNLYKHTSIEALAERLLRNIFKSHNNGQVLSLRNIVAVQSKSMQKWLELLGAKKYGVFAGVEFKDIREILVQCSYLTLGKPDEKTIFREEYLTWAIYKFLKSSSAKELQPLTEYYLNGNLDSEYRLYSISKEISAAFSDYQVYRPNMLNAWKNGSAFKTPDGVDLNWIRNEKWQRFLWKELHSLCKGKDAALSERYLSMLNALKAGEKPKYPLPDSISIFAPVSMPPLYLDILSSLAAPECRVDFYYLSPSAEYIGALLSDKTAGKEKIKEMTKNNSADIDDFYLTDGSRLVANFGKSAMSFSELLLSHDNIEEKELPDIKSDEQSPTLLDRIKLSVYKNDESCEKWQMPSGDASIRFHICHSPLREAEVLLDQILYAMDNFNISPADILVLTPDAEKYAAVIDSVIGNRKLRYSIADRKTESVEPVAKLLSLLFSQMNGRFEAPDIVSLFEYSLFVQGNPLSAKESELVAKWVKENAIRSGFEEDWEKGFRQLCAGFLMEADAFADNGDYCYSESEGVEAGTLFCRFMEFVNMLRSFSAKCLEPKSLQEWGDFFNKTFNCFFGNEDCESFRKAMQAWNLLREEIELGFGDDNAKVSFAALHASLPAKADSVSYSERFLTGGITVAEFATMRAIPFKMICCIGMNDKEFPKVRYKKEFNLMSDWNERGDRDLASEDKLAFIETIIAAQERLHISWCGKSDRTGDELPAAGVVEALRNHIKKYYSGETLELITIEHALQPFSSKYAKDSDSFFTYDNRWQCCENMEQQNPWQWRLKPPENNKEDDEPDIESILKAFKDAPREFLLNSCGIFLPEDKEALPHADSYSLSGLEMYKLNEAIIAKQQDILQKMKARGEIPADIFGDKIIDSAQKEMSALQAKRDEAIMGWIRPSKDSGDNRLRHYLLHLKENVNTPQKTQMILKDAEITLLPVKNAKEILNDLQQLKNELKTNMLPIFPNAAWAYLKPSKKARDENAALKNAWKEVVKLAEYSAYAKKLLGEAKCFEDLGSGVEGMFIKCSKKILGNLYI